MSTKFDVIVIGGGPGGTPAAMRLASQGKTVLLVEESGKLGGACLFVGCIPSKIIRHWADEYAVERKYSARRAWSSKDKEAVWHQIRSQMKVILDRRSGAAMKMLSQIPSLRFVAGRASFVSDKEVVIEEKDTGKKEHYTFDNAIVATGARSIMPPFKGNGVQHVLTNETLFVRDRLPETLLIVGGGPIGIELAQMLAKLGVKCTIIELLDSILSGVVEPEFISIIGEQLVGLGIAVHTSSKIQEINKNEGRFEITFTDEKGAEHKATFEDVLVATGKTPNIESLNLDSTKMKFSRKGITVNEYLETSVTGIYATGDVIPGPKFAHTATYEAYITVANILAGNSEKVAFTKNSWVLFSEPEIASAGLTENQAVEEGSDIITGVYDYKIDAAAQVMNAPFGYLKYVVDKKTLEVLGVHICHNNASFLAGEAALIVANRLTLKNIIQAIHPHPTLAEAFGVLAQNMLKKS